MITELTEYYEPEKILHRKEQIKEIDNAFKNFKKFGISSNLLIQGVTGSGKTTIVTKVIKDNTNENSEDFIFISGAETQTSFKTLRAIFDLNFSTIERVLTEGVKKLKVHPKIIIIDEVNKIRDCNNLFNNLNTIYRGVQCPIILITNKRTIVDSMPDDARLTLLFDKVNFPAYNSFEIKDIIKDRIKRIKTKIKFPEGALAKICAFSGRQGSARIALMITMKCILANDYSFKHIDKIAKNLEKEDWRIFIKGLTPSEKRFLEALLNISNSKQFMRHSDLTMRLKDLSPSRISQLVTSFEDYGILITEYKNFGRGTGRYRIIRFASKEIREKMEDVLYG